MIDKERNVVLISVDSLSTIDMEMMDRLPNMRILAENGTLIRRIRGIYPTQTYPLHVSAITGVYPVSHGIISNTKNTPGEENPEWFWYRKEIKSETLYDAAKKAGFRVGSLLWPAAGGAKIDYNLPEIVPIREDQNVLKMVFAAGTPFFILNMKRKFGHLLEGMERAHLDSFLASCACYLLKKKKTNLLLIHFLDLDHTRHNSGFLSKEAGDSLMELDRKIGDIISTVKEAGNIGNTTFIIFGDHAHRDVRHSICLNSIFRKEGLYDANINPGEWRAWANSCDGSAHVYLSDRDNRNDEQIVFRILQRIKKETNAIRAIYKREEIKKLNLSNEIDFIVEAAEGYYFSNSISGSLIDKSKYIATHGYLPESGKDYSSLFIASGNGIGKGLVLEDMDIIDIAPTIAALMGVSMPGVDGRVLREILTI